MEYCAFHAAASALRLYLSGAVSRESAPMLWTAGIFWISVSTATYLDMGNVGREIWGHVTAAISSISVSTATYRLSSLSKSSRVGSFFMNSLYRVFLSAVHSHS